MTEGAAGPASPDALLDLARSGFDLVQADPIGAARVLDEVRAEPGASPHARVIALWGSGRLAHDLGSMDDALIVLKEAVQLALDTGLSDIAAEVRVSWSVCMHAQGDTDGALAQLDLAEPELRGGSLGRLLMQRGLLLWMLGERERAVTVYDDALPLLVAASDELAATRLISNRGVVLLQLGDHERALADFTSSQAAALRLGQHAIAAGSAHNLAYLHGRLGRVALALRGFAEARQLYAAVGSPGRLVGALDIDECDVLLEAGLADEAVRLAGQVVVAARASGNTAQVAEALVLLARGQIMAGETAAALEAADEAGVLFARARRAPWVAIANYWAIVAASHDVAGPPQRVLRQFVRLRKVADRLEADGWPLEAAEVRVLTGRTALAAGRVDVAREALAAVAAARRHPFVRVRAEAWHASALLSVAAGQPAAARRALAAGLRSIDAYRATVGATELRSNTGRIGQPLAELGVRLALLHGNATAVLRWAERWRAGALGSASTDGDSDVADDLLDDLRAARRELAEMQSGGGDTAALASRASALEHAVSRKSRHSVGAGIARRPAFDPAQMRRALAADTLVEFVASDGELHALICNQHAIRHVAACGLTDARTAIEHLVFAMRRLGAVPFGATADRALVAFDHARTEVDDLLLGRASVGGGGRLVVVPTDDLHGVPWSALPSADLHGGITVAPSATWWCREDDGRPRPDAVLLVAGPQLSHGEHEVQSLRTLYPAATVLMGADATVAAVSAAMATSTMVHIAAHGLFRADNPQFSSLQLHDGPMYVHDLEALRRVPTEVVLTACSSGRSGVLPGNELLGTAAAMMRLGVRSITAPLVPVADVAAVEVAMALHTGRRAGDDPARALSTFIAAARARGRGDLLAAAVAFNCVAARG